MNAVALLTFPVLAFTPNGVMAYSRYENLLRVTKREYKMDWYRDLEIIDTKGTCVIVRSIRIVKESTTLAKIFGRMIEVEILESEKAADYDSDSTRSRVLEFLSLYPEMYQSAESYDDLVRRVGDAATSADIIKMFLE